MVSEMFVMLIKMTFKIQLQFTYGFICPGAVFWS